MKIYILVHYQYDSDGGNHHPENKHISLDERDCVKFFEESTKSAANQSEFTFNEYVKLPYKERTISKTAGRDEGWWDIQEWEIK